MTENKQLSAIYRFLAQAMRYPAKKWLADNYLARLLTFLELLDWRTELDELKQFDSQDPKAFEDLQVEYTRLFISAPGGVLAPPYGSVYLSESGTLLNEATEAVKNFYRQKGFALADEHEVADHIVNELDFLGLLTANDLTADEQLFLEQCFRPWFAPFYKLVLEKSELPFYVIIVKLINFFTTPEE